MHYITCFRLPLLLRILSVALILSACEVSADQPANVNTDGNVTTGESMTKIQPSCQTQCKDEVERLTRFFQDWYRGDIENTDEIFSRLSSVLSNDFLLITSSGFSVDREQLLAMLRNEHGSKKDIKIWSESFQLRLHEGNLCIFTYEEHGRLAGEEKVSLITAVMRYVPGLSDGMEWVHIHEVAMPAHQ